MQAADQLHILAVTQMLQHPELVQEGTSVIVWLLPGGGGYPTSGALQQLAVHLMFPGGGSSGYILPRNKFFHVASAAWSKMMYRAGPVELASCSFGQSSKVSYLQMITAVSAIVNGGKLMQPYIVAQARDADGIVLWKTEPTVKRQVISEETSKTMCLLMEQVVATGTGKNASVAGYRVGGKSGTSQKLDSEDSSARIASFVAVAPVENPRLAVLVCLDEPHSWTTSGGSLSAPVCAEVLAKSLPYLGIAPNYTEEEQQKLFSAVPDVTGWRTEAAAQKLREYGLTAHIDGDAERVVSQYPLPGVQVRKNSVVFLDTTGDNDPTLEE